jgi:hypothetical protein
MKTRTKVALVALVFAISLLVGFVVFGIYTARQANYYQGEIGRELDQILGFSHGSPYLEIGGEMTEVLTLHAIPDGVMSQAGVKDGDIVLGYSITDFYRSVHESRGSIFSFDVVDGGDGCDIDTRLRRRITVPISVDR